MIRQPEPEITGKLFDRKLTARLLRFAWPYKKRLGLSLLLMLLMSLVVGYLPMIVQGAVDGYLNPKDASLTVAERMTGLYRAAFLYLLGVCVAFFLRFGHSWLVTWAGQHIVYDIRSAIYKKVVSLPLGFMDRIAVGRLMTRVTSDVDALQRMVTDGVVGTVSDLFTLVAVAGYMFLLDARLAMVLFLVLPLLFYLVARLNGQMRSAQREVRRRQSALNAYLQEMITGMNTVQLFNRERQTIKRFDGHSEELRSAGHHTVTCITRMFPVMEVSSGVTFALVVCLGVWLLNHGSDLGVGVLLAFLLYVRDFFRPLEDLSDKSNILQSAMASSERIFALLDTPLQIEDPEHPESLEHFRGELALENVRFAYNDEDWVLKNVSFRVKPGESIALVGATGAGKTSVISLLARFYDVQEGRVTVDGQDVRRYLQSDLRRRIGVVQQEPFLFSGTIADNIGLHNPKLTRADIETAARYVNADAFISKLPGGYETEVQERGLSLSSGQKQLVALARTVAQNPDILLVLDEATAHIDTETELLIQKALHKLMANRTTVIIAHRLSTIKDVDRIIVMRHGTIVEEGSHRDLLDRNGYYRKLYELLSVSEHLEKETDCDH